MKIRKQDQRLEWHMEIVHHWTFIKYGVHGKRDCSETAANFEKIFWIQVLHGILYGSCKRDGSQKCFLLIEKRDFRDNVGGGFQARIMSCHYTFTTELANPAIIPFNLFFHGLNYRYLKGYNSMDIISLARIPVD